jgi:prolipoprotein diacylglyceryltransferase
MIVIAAVLLGAVTGALKARKRGGNTLDMLQYGAVYAIVFGILGLLATILTHRVLA